MKTKCAPDDNKLYDVHRYCRNGGGTALITHSNITVKQVIAPKWCSFRNSAECILIHGSFPIRLPIIYRHRYRHRFLSSFPNSPGPLNHFCYTRRPYCYAVFFRIAESFLDLIDSFWLAQHVHFATHVQGHTSDLVISRKMDSTSWRTDRSQVLCYADGTQMYIAFRPGNDQEESAVLTAMESCIADIGQWILDMRISWN